MLAYTYISHGKFELIDKPKPELQSPRDAIVRITLGSICTSDLHIKRGSGAVDILIDNLIQPLWGRQHFIKYDRPD